MFFQQYKDMSNKEYIFSFKPLRQGEFGISSAYGVFLAEAASHCLKLKKHDDPALLHVNGHIRVSGSLQWNDTSENLDSTYADLQEATEYGAFGVALVVAVKLTGIPFVQRSVKGTGIDWWLSEGANEGGLFQRAARLEISGILEGDEGLVSARLNKKLLQSKKSDTTYLPAYVAIVEFSAPSVRLVKRVNENK
jgi:hypothetical protein